MGRLRRTRLKADPEKIREWQRRSRKNASLKSTRLERKGGRIRAANPERKRKEWGRAYESEERVQWVQRQPCRNCGARPSENAHVKTGGMGRKADAKWMVPLCERCHYDLHSHGAETFQNGNGIDLIRAAEETERKWRETAGS